MLVGVTTNGNSFWPYSMWYEGSNRHNGEWTEANEAWFIKHGESIEMSPDGCLRSGRNWQTTNRSERQPHHKRHCSSRKGLLYRSRAEMTEPLGYI
jgi:hypothetical protein